MGRSSRLKKIRREAGGAQGKQLLNDVELLSKALQEVSNLPPAFRWQGALALLPDSTLETFAKSRANINTVSGSAALLAVSLLGMVMLGTKEISEEDLIQGTLGFRLSCILELERRHKRFSSGVRHMTDPFHFAKDDFAIFPRDDEPGDFVGMVFYYSGLANRGKEPTGKPAAESGLERLTKEFVAAHPGPALGLRALFVNDPKDEYRESDAE